MRTTVIALLATAILAAPGAFAQAQSATSSNGYYYWLHPKLGMVKVDKKTSAMLVGRRAQQGTGSAEAVAR
jgi:hypothetical protein